MKTKTCTKCKKEKSIKEFNINRANKDGLHYYCKECGKECSRERYKTNKEEIKEQKKEYRKANAEEIREKGREHYKANSEKIMEQRKEYYKNNPGKLKEIRAKSQAKIRQTFWGYYNALLSSLASRLIKGTIKISPTVEWVLACTSQQFIDHIISQLKAGTTRANYGKAWEIDHIMSKALLPYESFEDPNFRKLWCLENLRPLRIKENREKGKKTIK